jgi:hypothetical protein
MCLRIHAIWHPSTFCYAQFCQKVKSAPGDIQAQYSIRIGAGWWYGLKKVFIEGYAFCCRYKWFPATAITSKASTCQVDGGNHYGCASRREEGGSKKGSVYGMDQITVKIPNAQCRLYWCLIEFIDWRCSQSCWYCRPLM